MIREADQDGDGRIDCKLTAASAMTTNTNTTPDNEFVQLMMQK
jgi:hypothetical protein